MLRAQTLVTLKEYHSALFDVNRLIELNPSSEVYQNLEARLKTQVVLPRQICNNNYRPSPLHVFVEVPHILLYFVILLVKESPSHQYLKLKPSQKRKMKTKMKRIMKITKMKNVFHRDQKETIQSMMMKIRKVKNVGHRDQKETIQSMMMMIRKVKNVFHRHQKETIAITQRNLCLKMRLEILKPLKLASLSFKLKAPRR